MEYVLYRKAGELIAAGIKNLREGKVEAAAGFDGEYGKVTVLSAEERDRIEGQLTIDGLGGVTEKKKRPEGKKCLNRKTSFPP